MRSNCQAPPPKNHKTPRQANQFRGNIEAYYFGQYTETPLQQPRQGLKPTVISKSSSRPIRRGISLSLTKHKSFFDLYDSSIFPAKPSVIEKLPNATATEVNSHSPFSSVYFQSRQNQATQHLLHVKSSGTFGNTNRTTSCRSVERPTDSMISFQSRAKEPSTTHSFVGGHSEEMRLAKSLCTGATYHAAEPKRKHRPIFQKNRSDSPSFNPAKITSLAEVPLNYSIIIEDGAHLSHF